MIRSLKDIKPTLLVLSVLFVISLCTHDSYAESNEESSYKEPPKLVVGLVIDQMRPDYIFRYWDKFGENGFKRLVNGGTIFRNAHFQHLQTSTGPGHASPFTGTTPSVHGLIGNSWYDRESDSTIGVVNDIYSGYSGVGTMPGYPEDMAPNNMLTTTVGDELYLHTNKRSKIVGVSRKNRGAIIPAGHTGDAYWYEWGSGNFITSTYYRNELPEWVSEFNSKDLPQYYMKQTWETLLPIEEYVESREDDNPYEGMFPGMDRPVFPIDLARIVEEENQNPGILNRTPFIDKITLELAKAAINGEELGMREVSDILAISLSGADGIGHMFGPASKQVQDYYLRLDRYIADFLEYVDETLGMDNVLIFLTSDHGGIYIPEYLHDLKIPTGHTEFGTSVSTQVRDEISAFLDEKYGEDFLLSFSNQNVYLDHGVMDRKGLNHVDVQNAVKQFALGLNQIGGGVTAYALNNHEFTTGMRAKAKHAFHQKRSGDVVLWYQAQTHGVGTGSTGHVSGWAYDTHAPIIFYGFNVPGREIYEKVHVTDIASTVSVYLNSPFPSGNIGNPLNGFMKLEY